MVDEKKEIIILLYLLASSLSISAYAGTVASQITDGLVWDGRIRICGSTQKGKTKLK